MPDLYMDVDINITVPCNIFPLIDDTDFKSIEDNTVAYNAGGLEVYWNFVTTAGAQTSTVITPTTAGNYDWSHIDGGMYKIEIPATGGASANNDTEGFGWITGKATGVLPFRGPTIGFRRAALNDLLIDGSIASTNMEHFYDGTGYAGGTIKLASDATLNGTQGAVTFGQVKIVANAANEGALDIRNANANGIGMYNQGGDVGLYNDGTALYGQYNVGADTGLYNNGTGVGAYGNYNAGVAIGQYNAASGAASVGQTNQGVVDGQYNTGTGAAGIGSKNEGTIYGMQAIGGTADTDPAIPGAAPTAASIADAVLDEALAGHLAAGSTGAAINAAGGAATVFPAGAIEFTYTVTDSSTGLPLEGVEVWISTDNPAVNIVWKGDTDAFGIAMDVLGNKPKLDPGTYYFWRQLAGFTFTDPDTEVVS